MHFADGGWGDHSCLEESADISDSGAELFEDLGVCL
jgi:hypothetical protein